MTSASLTQQSQHELAGQIIEYLRDGEVNPLELTARIKFAYETLGEVLKSPDLIDAVATEREKYGREEKVGALGVTIETAQRVTRDFSTCGDSVWNRLMEEEKLIAEKRKSREKMLMAIHDKMVVVDELTGEAMEIYSPRLTYTYFVKATLPKA